MSPVLLLEDDELLPFDLNEDGSSSLLMFDSCGVTGGVRHAFRILPSPLAPDNKICVCIQEK